MKIIKVKLKYDGISYFKFGGIASSESIDSYGEIINQSGINLSLVKEGKVIVNSEHGNEIIGRIESAQIVDNKLHVEGVVFVKTIAAKKFYELLKLNDPNKPVTLSIELINLIYSKDDKSFLKESVLSGVALVGINNYPANKDTYAELLKSIKKEDLIIEIIRRAERNKNFKARLLKLLSRF